MKKILKYSLLVTLILGALWILFYRDLASIYGWYILENTAIENPSVFITPGNTVLEFKANVKEPNNYKIREFINLQVPMIFDDGFIKKESESMLVYMSSSTNKAILITHNSGLANQFLNSNDMSGYESYGACAALSQNSNNICDSNYEFYKALLSLHPDQVGLFSKTDDRLFIPILLLLKGTYLTKRPTEISPVLIKDSIQGFMMKGPIGGTDMVLFDSDNTVYEITVINDDGELSEKLLNNLSLKNKVE